MRVSTTTPTMPQVTPVPHAIHGGSSDLLDNDVSLVTSVRCGAAPEWWVWAWFACIP